jgi:membrane glycosyltransferase
MENWKDIVVEEDWASKVGLVWASKVRLVPLFLMGWEAPIPDVMLEFLTHSSSRVQISILGIRIRYM